eukprot:TsM_000593400 transcript=TsM_000593400 gene=TsM_000593400
MALNYPRLYFFHIIANKDGGVTVTGVKAPKRPEHTFLALACSAAAVAACPNQLVERRKNRRHHHLIDWVQQYSEKRACIIAAPADCGDSHFPRCGSSGIVEFARSRRTHLWRANDLPCTMQIRSRKSQCQTIIV